MENPVKYMESRDKQAVKTLGETGGLGTVATRADIIDKLFHSYLMELRGKEIYITSKGKQLLELVPEDLRKPELTADWEMKLSQYCKRETKKRNLPSGDQRIYGGDHRRDQRWNRNIPT